MKDDSSDEAKAKEHALVETDERKSEQIKEGFFEGSKDLKSIQSAALWSACVLRVIQSTGRRARRFGDSFASSGRFWRGTELLSSITATTQQF